MFPHPQKGLTLMTRLQVHFRKRPIADDVDLMQLARDLPGLSGLGTSFKQ